MKYKMRNIQKHLAIIAVLFFGLGIININLSLFGVLCISLPFLIRYLKNKNLWCLYICPRKGMLKILGKVNLGLSLPKWFKDGTLKKFFLYYFFVNISIMVMTTVMVSLGKMQPMEMVRFMILFKAPFDLPQLINFEITNYLTHLSYRVYSMFYSTTILGILFGILFKPTTWCVVCPVNSLLSSRNKK